MTARRPRPIPEVLRAYKAHVRGLDDSARRLRDQLQAETARADRAERAVRDLVVELERERRRSTSLTSLLASHGLLPSA